MSAYTQAREHEIVSLSEKYVVVLQPKIHLLRLWEDGRVIRLSRKAFGEAECSRWHMEGNKRVKGTKVFLDAALRRDPVVRVVHEVIWDPTQPAGLVPRTVRSSHEPSHNWNLFIGWDEGSADDGDLAFILEWMRDYVASGDRARYLWLENFLAHMLQYPEEQPGVAIALPDTFTSGVFANVLLMGLVGEAQWGELSHTRHAACHLYEQSVVLKSFESVSHKVLRQLVLEPTRPIKLNIEGRVIMRNALRVVVLTWDEGFKEGFGSDTFMRDPLNQKVFRSLQTRIDHKEEHSMAMHIQDELSEGAIGALRHYLLNLPDVVEPM